MAAIHAILTNKLVLRGFAIAAGFALLLYGHEVLLEVQVFGIFTALCMFAVAIVFYQTSSGLTVVPSRTLGTQDEEVDARAHLQMLKKELLEQEAQYKHDLKRLQRKWL